MEEIRTIAHASIASSPLAYAWQSPSGFKTKEEFEVKWLHSVVLEHELIPVYSDRSCQTYRNNVGKISLQL